MAQVEPWMRGTHEELDPLRRAVVHALEQAEEDVARWCGELEAEAMFARPWGLPSVAFHLRHMARSLDRLLTYAEGRALDATQLAGLQTEMDAGETDAVRMECQTGLRSAKDRALRFVPASFGDARVIGRLRLPSTVGGILVHCAEHTQRHVGHIVTTVKVLGL